MTNTKHTAGPQNFGVGWDVVAEHGMPLIRKDGIGMFVGNTGVDAFVVADRVVGCLKACEGINPEAVPEILTLLRTIVTRLGEKNECRFRPGTPSHDDLRALLAKAELQNGEAK